MLFGEIKTISYFMSSLQHPSQKKKKKVVITALVNTLKWLITTYMTLNLKKKGLKNETDTNQASTLLK